MRNTFLCFLGRDIAALAEVLLAALLLGCCATSRFEGLQSVGFERVSAMFFGTGAHRCKPRFFSALYWPLGPLQSSHHTIFWVSRTGLGRGRLRACSVVVHPMQPSDFLRLRLYSLRPQLHLQRLHDPRHRADDGCCARRMLLLFQTSIC